MTPEERIMITIMVRDVSLIVKNTGGISAICTLTNGEQYSLIDLKQILWN